MNKEFKILILGLFMIFPLASSYAQTSGSVTYKSVWICNYWLLEAEGVLNFTSEESFFATGGKFSILAERNLKNYVNGEATEVITNRPKKTNIQTVFDPFFTFTHLKDGEVMQRVLRSDSTHQVLIDNFGIIKWTVEQEMRQIGEFSAQKATATFRGRSYTAWFAPKIPVPFGPWKLSGLPGLVLEVSDSKNEVSFVATSVKLGAEPRVNLAQTHKEFLAVKDQMVYQDYVLDRDRRNKERFEKMNRLLQSRASEGSVTNLTKIKNPTLEMEFEFSLEP